MRTFLLALFCVISLPMVASANTDAALEAAMSGLTEEQENNILSAPVMTSFQLSDGSAVQMLSLPATPHNVTGTFQKDGGVYEFSSTKDTSGASIVSLRDAAGVMHSFQCSEGVCEGGSPEMSALVNDLHGSIVAHTPEPTTPAPVS